MVVAAGSGDGEGRGFALRCRKHFAGQCQQLVDKVPGRRAGKQQPDDTYTVDGDSPHPGWPDGVEEYDADDRGHVADDVDGDLSHGPQTQTFADTSSLLLSFDER